jgi:hypothetical protein
VRRGLSATLTLLLALGLALAASQPALASVGMKQISVTPEGRDPARDSTPPHLS